MNTAHEYCMNKYSLGFFFFFPFRFATDGDAEATALEQPCFLGVVGGGGYVFASGRHVRRRLSMQGGGR